MQNYLKYLLIAIVSVVIYASSLDYEAVKCDDTRLIEHYTDKNNTQNTFFSEFTKSYMNTDYYRPLVNISFRLDAAIFGDDAGDYHKLNIALHIIFCILLYITVSRLSDSETLALIAAMIYAAHPMFANAVAWIPGRNDIMLGVFGLSAFLFFDNYIDSKKTKDLVLNTVFLLFALFSKETAIVLPFLFLTYMFIRQSKSLNWKTHRLLYIAWASAIIFWLILLFSAEKGESANIFGFGVFFSNLRVISEYLSGFIIPTDLSVLPTYSMFSSLLGSILLLGFAAWIFFADTENKKMAGWALLWFILLILPTTIFKRGNADEWNDYLYCRAYLPLAGIVMMLSILIKDKVKNLNKMMLFSIGLLPILLLAYINYNHSEAYSSPVNFYDNAISKDSTRAYYYQIIGNYFTEKGKFEKAQAYFEKAAGNQEGYYKRHFQLGEIAMMKKEYSKAIGHYKDALRLKPDEKNLMFALSQAYISAVQTDSAKSVWTQMTEKFPDSPEAYFELFNLALMNFDYDMIDKYGKAIVKAKFQNKVLSGRLNAVAQEAFKEKALRDAVFFWDYAYAMDTANYKLLKYISGTYYVLLEKDSTRKYYNLFKEKGGSFSQAEEDTYTKFLN